MNRIHHRKPSILNQSFYGPVRAGGDTVTHLVTWSYLATNNAIKYSDLKYDIYLTKKDKLSPLCSRSVLIFILPILRITEG